MVPISPESFCEGGEAKEGELAEVSAHLPPVKVLDDGEVQVLLPLPLALHGVVEELPEWPVGPLQQLVVQQQRVGRLCTRHTGQRKVGCQTARGRCSQPRAHTRPLPV